MIETALSLGLGFLLGLGGTWVIRNQQAYERAIVILLFYIPLSALAIIIGIICGWLTIGHWSDAAPFSGVVGWMGCLLGMLTNICSKPPPRLKPDPKDQF